MYSFFDIYKQLAEDILTEKFCEGIQSFSNKREMLTRILIDIYLKGRDDKGIE